MLKKILSYGAVEGIAKGLNKLTFLLLPLLLGTMGYGKVGLLVSLELIVPIISLLGLERAVLRFYSKESKLLFFKKTVYTVTFYTHLILLLLISVFYLLGKKDFFGLDLFPDIFLIILIIYFQGRNLITLNMLRVGEEHKKYFKGRLFLQITKFCLVLSLVYFLDSYLGYLIGALIAVILTNIFFNIGKEQSYVKESFNKNTFLTLFTFSWPFIFHGIAGSLLGNADKFILEEYLSLHDVGLYTFAYAMGSTMVFAYVGISVFMEPMIYKEDNEKKRETLLNKYLFLATIFGLLLYTVISMVTLFILPIFYANDYKDVFSFIPLLATAYFVYPYYLTSNYRMIYNKKSLHIAIVSVISASINIGLNIYFVPKFGIYGAVVTTVFSYILQALMFIFMSNRFKPSIELLEVVFLGGTMGVLLWFKFPFYFFVIPFLFFIGYLYFSKIKNIGIER